MLRLEDFKVVFVAVGLVGALLFASPSLGLVLHLPEGERFSELWILGPGHMAEDYPDNVTAGVDYLVYLGVGNHMGSSVYYDVEVKFRNQSEPLPNSAAGTASPLAPLYEYRVFVEDGKSWEAALTFSFAYVSQNATQCLVRGFAVNGVAYEIDKYAAWDGENRGFYYELFVELWIYGVESDAFEYHDRFVTRWLNMTVSS
jgi:hypothetical protein